MMAWRSPNLAIEVVRNKRGWFINESYNGMPTRSHGPLEGPVSLGEALIYVGSLMKMEGTDVTHATALTEAQSHSVDALVYAQAKRGASPNKPTP